MIRVPRALANSANEFVVYAINFECEPTIYAIFLQIQLWREQFQQQLTTKHVCCCVKCHKFLYIHYHGTTTNNGLDPMHRDKETDIYYCDTPSLICACNYSVLPLSLALLVFNSHLYHNSDNNNINCFLYKRLA